MVLSHFSHSAILAMLGKKHRFSFKDKLPSRVLNFPSFSIRYGRNEDELKVAVVVSKRIDKRATVRNRIKRRVLNAIRKTIDLDKALNLVFYIKKNAQSSENLENEVERAINNLATKQ